MDSQPGNDSNGPAVPAVAQDQAPVSEQRNDDSAQSATEIQAAATEIVDSQTQPAVQEQEQPAAENQDNVPMESTNSEQPEANDKKEEVKPPRFTCMICYCEADGFAFYDCDSCNGHWCAGCVKTEFNTAVRNLMSMPAKCCDVIPLHDMLPLVTDAEAQRYRERFQERATYKSIYCPIPTCSAFIPDYLINERLREQSALKKKIPEITTTSKDEAKIDDEIVASDKFSASVSVDCPKCATSVCTNCRNITHGTRPCSTKENNGMTKEERKLLKQWGYKRCPKCRAGIRRMYGCSFMQCHCGEHFCYSCLQTSENCSGCSGEDSDSESESESGTDVVNDGSTEDGEEQHAGIVTPPSEDEGAGQEGVGPKEHEMEGVQTVAEGSAAVEATHDPMDIDEEARTELMQSEAPSNTNLERVEAALGTAISANSVEQHAETPTEQLEPEAASQTTPETRVGQEREQALQPAEQPAAQPTEEQLPNEPPAETQPTEQAPDPNAIVNLDLNDNWAATGLNFGDEPGSHDAFHLFNCRHHSLPTKLLPEAQIPDYSVSSKLNRVALNAHTARLLECWMCWRPLHIDATDPEAMEWFAKWADVGEKLVPKGYDEGMVKKVEELVARRDGATYPAFLCDCSMIMCGRCAKLEWKKED